MIGYFDEVIRALVLILPKRVNMLGDMKIKVGVKPRIKN